MANGHQPKFHLSEEQLSLMRGLWECTPLSAAKIAKELGVTRNTVIGRADRRGWISFNKPSWRYEPKTTNDRLGELNHRMDSLL